MVRLAVYLLLVVAAMAIVAAPWATVMLYFLNGIMQPSFVWPWEFPSFTFMSLSKILAILSILAWMKAVASKGVDFSIYNSPQNFAILIMWVLMHLSDILSPYPVYFAGVRAEIVLDAMNTIVIMYFIGLGILSDVRVYKKAFLGMSIMFAYISVYYVYWANDVYLDNNWSMFFDGRLKSPPGTTIGDQNALSCLIVMGMPFVFLGYFYIKNFFLKWGSLAVLPLLWHSLFLFGSRGAMIALVCTTILCLQLLKPYKAKKKNKNGLWPKEPEEKTENTDAENARFKSLKLFKIAIMIGLVGAIATQGGAMLNRSTETIDVAKSDTEKPINPRIVSWNVGLSLIAKYPVFGVGPQRFQMASNRLFPGRSVHVAHNTFLNFAANTGLPVGLLFLFLFWTSYKNYTFCRNNGIANYPILEYVNIACSAALVGFFISALFLDMIIFEAFYFILALNLAKLFTFKKLLAEKGDVDKSITPTLP
ncbi:O-antigen ligase family protein [Alteromonas sp. 5E99-2]|uniref:O-antigen ligase family protein n=1 Tax=Alteromonas sp. 5E99-2 TaxID=2817683 RepID=UPI001A9849AD|nr:O-antigen ligase family protein [Alteromonas sp. 5E99-2]MBO1255019.1 O-antigen ligase family protein [Alteromonas sp. 5E99-2]